MIIILLMLIVTEMIEMPVIVPETETNIIIIELARIALPAQMGLCVGVMRP